MVEPNSISHGTREEIVGGRKYRWDGVEVWACVFEESGAVEPVRRPEDLLGRAVSTVSVYLHLRNDGPTCIADCASVSDAILIARALSFGTADGMVDMTWPGLEVGVTS